MREHPYAEQKQQVDEVAQVGKEVVEAPLLVGVKADGHKV